MCPPSQPTNTILPERRKIAIAAGETSATLSVATADDGEDEADGTVTVTLDAGEGYEVGDPRARR